MKAQGLRVEVDDSDDRMQKKIRNAQLQKVPFMVIAGDNDVEAGAVSFRYRDGRQDNGVPDRRGDRPGRRGRRPRGCRCDTTRATPTDRMGFEGFDRLWTPHRLAYVAPSDPVDQGCPFCAMEDMPPEESLVVATGEHCFAVLNLHPYNPGHLMVLPLAPRGRARGARPATRRPS